MPSILKNASVAYQREITALSHDMMHKEKEVHVDDMIAKSTTEDGHIVNLRKILKS